MNRRQLATVIVASAMATAVRPAGAADVPFGPQLAIAPSSHRPTSVFAVDLDGDGDADVLSASRWDDKIEWYENEGG